MTPSDLTADLPAPRDDEPASLRADIADELADHLQCAVRREELRSNSEPWGSAPRSGANDGTAATDGGASSCGRSPDQSSCGRSPDRATDGGAEPRRSRVYERVLARFGDPRAIARKLWWDAMREKIMGQRISLLMQGLMAVVVIVMCVVVWQTMQQNARVQAELVATLNQTQNDLLRSQREANAELAERLAALAARSPESAEGAPPEWNSLKVKCTFDTEDGLPVPGVEVSIQGATTETQRVPGDIQTSDADGMIDFGKVLFGSYELRCRTRDGLYLMNTIAVRPGQAKVVNIVCPGAPPPAGAVKFDIQPPEAWRAFPLYYLAVVERANHHFGKQWWSVSASQFHMPCYVLGADGQVLGELDEATSKVFSERISGGQPQVTVIDSTLREHLRRLQIKPVVERPAYLLTGQLVALIAEPGQPEDVPEGQLPPLVPLTQGSVPATRTSSKWFAWSTPCDKFHTNSEDGTIRVNQSGEAFWKVMAAFMTPYMLEKKAAEVIKEG